MTITEIRFFQNGKEFLLKIADGKPIFTEGVNPTQMDDMASTLLSDIEGIVSEIDILVDAKIKSTLLFCAE